MTVSPPLPVESCMLSGCLPASSQQQGQKWLLTHFPGAKELSLHTALEDLSVSSKKHREENASSSGLEGLRGLKDSLKKKKKKKELNKVKIN